MNQKPVFRPKISTRNWVLMIVIGIVFWSALFYFCTHPWILLKFLIAFIMLLIARAFLNPTPKKEDPLDQL